MVSVCWPFYFRKFPALVLLTLSANAAAAIPQAERDALLALYNSTGGAQWEHNLGWNGPPGTECDWDSVVCDSTGATVIELHLSYNNMTGTLPSLSALGNLQFFDVNDNTLSGSLPALAGLSKLQYFNVLNNGFSGPIPALTGLTNLQYFNLDSNFLSGPFPSLTGLSNLQVFDIGENHHTFDDGTGDSNGITGTLPSLAALTQLQVFYVSGNKLSGALPDLTPLKLLQEFWAAGSWTGDGNHFTGPVPTITGFSALQYFDVHNNQLTGTVPALSGLPNLHGFSVGQNPLSGTIPALNGLTQIQYLGFYSDGLSGQIPSLSGLNQLIQISVGDNALTGSIPSLTGLTNLQLFEASYNHLTGQLPALTGLGQLQVFNAAVNDLTGPIPSLAGLAALQEFDVAYNHLSGSIPALGESPQLYQFSVNDNELTGSIPSFAGLTNLTALEFSDNQLTGSIPAIDGSPLLRYFSAARNFLSGSAPTLAGLSQLNNFNVSFNQLTGAIPALSGLANLQYAYFDFNKLSGPIPALTGLTNLTEFVVLDNQLSGTIPALSGLANLQAFNAERNQLSGALPALSGLTNLSYFSVSSNQLSGTLPQLSGLGSLNTFDVSFNAISGTIPALNQLPNLQDLYLDVNQLTGPIPNLSSLANLRVFDAGNNQLTGAIPALVALSNLQQFNVFSNALTGSLPPLTGLSNLQYFQVGSNFLSGAIPAVPNPNNLVGGLSSLCPNALTLTPDSNWDLAVGNEPWYAICATPESAKQALTAKDSTHIALSGNGSVKVFQSQEATLVPGNVNTTGQDIYSVGADGVPVLEDIDESGNQMIGIASVPAVSSDGKVVAFQFAPLAGFFAGPPNAIAIYAGLQGAPKHRVDVGPGGTNASGSAAGAPSLAGVNGNYRLAFCSSASNLVSGDTNLLNDVFVADPLNLANPIQRVSLDSNGNEIAGDSCEPKLSADGNKVVFSIRAPALFTTPARQIVLKDLSGTPIHSAATVTSTTTPGQLNLMSAMAATNQPANADSGEPTINADGSVVAFTSQASNLDALGSPVGGKEVFVALGNGTVLTRARSGDGTVPNGASQQPQLSADGTTVVMQSDATNWQGGTIGECGAVALNTNFFALAPVGGTLCGSSETTVTQNPAISADGIVTGFDSNARQVNGNTNANTYAQGMGSFAGVSGMAVPNLNGDLSGQWFNPDQSGHGLVIDVTKPDANNKRLLVLTWFVYRNGKPTWVQGVGVPHAGSGPAANSVVVQLDQVGIFKGASFPLGAAHASANLWGGITLNFTDANTGTLTWKSTYPGFGSGSMPIKHFLAVGLPGQDAPGAQVKSCYSGNWFNPAQSGHGFEFEVLNAPGSTSNYLAVDWFAYAPDGSPVWLSGSAPITGNSAQMHLTLIDGAGAQFPPNFSSGGITGHDWGTATFTFTDAAHAQVTWSSTIPGYASGTQPLQPLGVGLLDRRGCQ
jgi:Leucine-rich repeat (LRR) protein